MSTNDGKVCYNLWKNYTLKLTNFLCKILIKKLINERKKLTKKLGV